MNKHMLVTKEMFYNFITAGNAYFTLVSKKTNVRFTYRIKQSDDKLTYFVSILSGPDNWFNYKYIGCLMTGDDSYLLKRTYRSEISHDSLSFKALIFALKHPESKDLEIWHEGKCGKCGRKLTVPSSIELGLGPTCAKRV